MPAVDAWFDQHQPELVAAEYVIINRDMHGTGYGGTPDGMLKIGGELYAIDWKSRGQDSDHGAYPEEAEQIAAGVIADYMIVQGPNGPMRQLIPTIRTGLIISIRPDGCRTYPVDIEAAGRQWTARHAWWCARRNERVPIGRQWAAGTKNVRPAEPVPASPATPAAPTVEQKIANLRERCKAAAALHPDARQILLDNFAVNNIDLRATTLTDLELHTARRIVETAERIASAPFNDIAPAQDPRLTPGLTKAKEAS